MDSLYKKKAKQTSHGSVKFVDLYISLIFMGSSVRFSFESVTKWLSSGNITATKIYFF